MTTSLRTTTVAQGWPTDTPGGLNRYVADLHAALPGAGVDDELVVFGPAADAPGRVRRAVVESSSLPQRLVSSAAQVRASLRTSDVLVTHFALYGAVPALLPLGRAKPLVAHFHGPWAEESLAQGASGLGPRVKGRVEGGHLRRADAVITASQAFADLVTELHGLDPAAVHPVHPGVDAARFHPLGDEQRARVRADLGVAPGTHLVVTARRLVPRMGLETLLEAWPGEAGGQLVVIGDGPERGRLAALADRRGGGTVHFTGRVGDDDLVRWYQAADLVVVPSIALEGFGLVVLEALACGTPVIASDVGGLGEVLPEAGNGLLLPPGDVDAWRERLTPGGGELPDRAHCRAVAEAHSLERFAQEVTAVYRGAFSSTGR